MNYSKLGSSGINVSRVCLGSMTWGTQNTQRDASEQIDFALAQGVNFIDTAEMYAVPPSADTYGKTEKMIGNWLAANSSKRGDIILASKIAGNGLPWIRGGGDITGESIITSVDASLKRLKTDYIDLYQLHWPNRTSPHFAKHFPGRISFTDVDRQAHSDQMLEILQALNDCIKAGKIRHCGLSDDTPWGINEYLRLAEKHSLPKMVSIQNEFNLLHTKDWPYLIENCVHQDVAYLPWSPLGGGVLSGKYLNGERPDGSRWSIPQRNGILRDKPNVETAVSAYASIAKQLDITPAQLALAWCNQVDGVTSTIIGATSLQQLEEDIEAFKVELSKDDLKAIFKVLREYPLPF
ncbi:aldo/keto reductase [Oleiphilus sp. HI0068]|jgi:aryl-alcohol dehydrogenase-like predicted oxidoreductase|uniref:aldo/keto reductase n=3 Tax=Oleiphilus TaxID=141450 RepID=UPI0007C3E9CA|nr:MULTISPECIES: aldo/keto reductase [unclassified Oleiphilus]KZY44897.1 aldo/keto reductase [Oleiphilus sp. HI0050]KZY75089.1 aldo/keto reductase [Oleiphilus sp. HI0068]KZY79003.1 aldo/keto reductase [Oleiphilus sp. HI0069]KZY59536.1 aldo/keto reductase [Oleiphilus sp. HI0061]KZZ79947.1 aldo/keto reductase [Oleiphilus sp. HI0132]